MDETLTTFASTAVPPRNKPVDPRADPKYWGYTWTNWCDYVKVIHVGCTWGYTWTNWCDYVKVIHVGFTWGYTWTNWCDYVKVIHVG